MAIPHICGDQVGGAALPRTLKRAPLGLVGASLGHLGVPFVYGKIC